MRFSPQFRMSVTRRGEKEQRLCELIGRGLAAHGGMPVRGGGISVIARSLASPVARAIGALAGEIAAAGLSVRVLVMRGEGAGDVRGFPQAAGLDCEVRLAKDPRLIEAHEQLALGPGTCWTGDSMRRDPSACDAYESFVEDCAEIAGAAQSTFERLWSGGEPLFTGPVPAAVVPAADGPSRMQGPPGICGEA
jgi:hypothetical protein